MSQADELRLLEQKRLAEGLSPEEEARRASLVADPSLPGFDVNAAAAELRASLDSAARSAPELLSDAAIPEGWSSGLGQGWGLRDEQALAADADPDPELPTTAPPDQAPPAPASYTAEDYGLDPNDPDAVAWATWYAQQGWDPATAYAYAQRMNEQAAAGAAVDLAPLSFAEPAPGGSVEPAPAPELEPVTDLAGDPTVAAEPDLGSVPDFLAKSDAPIFAPAPWDTEPTPPASSEALPASIEAPPAPSEALPASIEAPPAPNEALPASIEAPAATEQEASSWESPPASPAPWDTAPAPASEGESEAKADDSELPTSLPEGKSLWELITGMPRPPDLPLPGPALDDEKPAGFTGDAGTMLLLDQMEPTSPGSFEAGEQGEPEAAPEVPAAQEAVADVGPAEEQLAPAPGGPEIPSLPEREEIAAPEQTPHADWEVQEQGSAEVAGAEPSPPAESFPGAADAGPWQVGADPTSAGDASEAELLEIADDDIVPAEDAEPAEDAAASAAEAGGGDAPLETVAESDTTSPLDAFASVRAFEPVPALAPVQPGAEPELDAQPLSFASADASALGLDAVGEKTAEFATRPADPEPSATVESSVHLDPEVEPLELPAPSAPPPDPGDLLAASEPPAAASILGRLPPGAPEPTLTFVKLSESGSRGGWDAAPRPEAARLVPERPAAVLDTSFEPEEPAPQAEPEVQPAELSPACFISGTHRVVVHTADGQVRRGTVSDVALDGDVVLLAPPAGGVREPVPTDQIKAIFFMLPLGETPPAPEGKKVRVTFRDGRQVAGFSPDYDPERKGFFMVPADTRTHTARIWVYRTSVRQVWVS